MQQVTSEDRRGSYHDVKEGRGTEAPKTESVVVQARYTHSATERWRIHIYAIVLGKSDKK